LRNLRKFFGIKFQIKTTESKIVYQEDEEEANEEDIEEEGENIQKSKPKLDISELRIPQ